MGPKFKTAWIYFAPFIFSFSLSSTLPVPFTNSIVVTPFTGQIFCTMVYIMHHAMVYIMHLAMVYIMHHAMVYIMHHAMVYTMHHSMMYTMHHTPYMYDVYHAPWCGAPMALYSGAHHAHH